MNVQPDTRHKHNTFKNTIPSPTFACHYVNPPGSYLIGGHSVTEGKQLPGTPSQRAKIANWSASRHRGLNWKIVKHAVTVGYIGKLAGIPSQMAKFKKIGGNSVTEG